MNFSEKLYMTTLNKCVRPICFTKSLRTCFGFLRKKYEQGHASLSPSLGCNGLNCGPYHLLLIFRDYLIKNSNSLSTAKSNLTHLSKILKKTIFILLKNILVEENNKQNKFILTNNLIAHLFLAGKLFNTLYWINFRRREKFFFFLDFIFSM